jgi:methylated-DNA-[protein]-cysteine S-methyltransferase
MTSSTPSWFEVVTPLGRWRGTMTSRGLSKLELLPARGDVPTPDGRRDDRHPAVRELRDYFAGRRRVFSTPVDLSGEPTFRRKVLEALCAIPFGATTTYGELARRAGKPNAARAVGQALGANPVPVVVPCHRVLQAGGRLGGFGLGLDAKRLLLALEGVAIPC